MLNSNNIFDLSELFYFNMLQSSAQKTKWVAINIY